VYMAPEQLRGEPPSAASDQFAWGVLAYELLTGKPPWDDSRGNVLLISQVFSLLPPAPSTTNRELPSHVDAVVLRALEKSPAERFHDMAALAVAFESCSPPETAIRSPEARRGSTLIVGVLGLIVA